MLDTLLDYLRTPFIVLSGTPVTTLTLVTAIAIIAVVLLVGIGFGLQKLAENFISGLLLLIERPVRKGDFIDVAGVLGTVEDIGLRATHVVSRDGLTMAFPRRNRVASLDGQVVRHRRGRLCVRRQ